MAGTSARLTLGRASNDGAISRTASTFPRLQHSLTRASSFLVPFGMAHQMAIWRVRQGIEIACSSTAPT